MSVHFASVVLLVLLAEPSQPLAFEGALGFGRFAQGGSGGAPVLITSLLDYPPGHAPIPGTLRWAIEELTGPRIILFAVSGKIALTTQLALVGKNGAYVTLDGRTPDGAGVTIGDHQFGAVNTHDIIIRFLRFRSDEDGTLDHGERSLSLFANAGKTTHDIIVDHCSIERSDDDDLSIWDNCERITIQWCYLGDGRNSQLSKATITGGYEAPASDEYITFCYNLFTNSYSRLPQLGGPGRIDFYNNAVIHSVLQMMILASYVGQDSPRINLVSNYFQYQDNYPWPSPYPTDVITATPDYVQTPASMFLANNWVHGTCSSDPWSLTGIWLPYQGEVGHTDLPDDRRRQVPWPSDMMPASVRLSLERILREGGCRIAGQLDAIDEKLVDNARTRHATIPPFP
ncbi:MAG: hypothetical protein U1E76_15220 [Planctomycetota bacterium]